MIGVEVAIENKITNQLETILKDFLNKLKTKMDEILAITAEPKISELQNRLEIMSMELNKADVEIERLNLENELLKERVEGGLGIDVLHFSKFKITKSEFIKTMWEILDNTQHNVMIIVPFISDLEVLEVFKMSSSVNIRIACSINPASEEHLELLKKYTNINQIKIRNYPGEDRYIILRDGEDLLFVAVGEDKSTYLMLHTKDTAHLAIFNSLAMDAWLRSREF